MHRDSGIVSIMHISSDVHLYLLQLVGMLEQYTVKNGYIKQPEWMHWVSGIVSIMHIWQHTRCRILCGDMHC